MYSYYIVNYESYKIEVKLSIFIKNDYKYVIDLKFCMVDKHNKNSSFNGELGKL